MINITIGFKNIICYLLKITLFYQTLLLLSFFVISFNIFFFILSLFCSSLLLFLDGDKAKLKIRFEKTKI